LCLLNKQQDTKREREGRNSYKSLVGIPEGKRPPGKTRHRRKYNTIMDLTEAG
jgi:hypothetical protein